ncbi:MAG: CHAT domain-containing protein [Bacteroidales bacterium]|nr:CHAT domain-containing protein [Bacteroidales bacterium]
MKHFVPSCILLLMLAFPAGAQTIRQIKAEAAGLAEQGRYDEAIEMLHSHAGYDKDYYPFDISLFEAYSRKALDLKDNSLYSAAERVYWTALADTLMTPYTTAVMELNYADLLLRRGMYSTADKRLDAIRDYVTSSDDDYLECDWSLRKAETLSYLKQYAQAKGILLDLIPRKDVLTPEKTAEIHSTLGFILLNEGQSDAEALSHLQTALEMTPEGVASYALLSNIALVKARMGRTEEAVEDIESCISWWQSVPGYTESTEYGKCLRKKAEILFIAGRRGDSRKCFEEYFRGERAILAAQYPGFNSQQRMDYWKNRNPLLSEMYVLENDCPELLFDLTVFRRAITMLGQESPEELKRQLNMDSKAIRSALGKDDAVIEFVRYARSFVPAGDTTARYGAIVLPSRKSGREPAFVPLWTEAEINGYRLSNGRTLMEAIVSPRAEDKDVLYTDSSLAAFVWAPLQPYLEGSTRIFFVPEGILNLMAIEYLPADRPEGVELRRMTSSANILQDRTNLENLSLLAVGGLNYSVAADEERPMDADYEAYDYFVSTLHSPPRFRGLSGTLYELAAIDTLGLSRSVRTELYEDAAKDSLRAFSAFHIGTHAYSLRTAVVRFGLTFDEDTTEDRSLLASGLVLSGANVSKKKNLSQDGLLSAREISEMKLKDMSLVVLSACESATGLVSDEGPTGFIRGFKIAGAGTILATLWPVNDSGTACFMGYFYGALSETGDPYQALRTAQSMLRSHRVPSDRPAFYTLARVDKEEEPEWTTPFGSPYYWAPFVLIDSF